MLSHEARRLLTNPDELVFVALGGLGEIGMNAALYGYGPPSRRKWVMIDCGLGFAGPDLPGIDLVYADIGFVEKIRRDLVGLVITHAHEDHVGGIAALWSKRGNISARNREPSRKVEMKVATWAGSAGRKVPRSTPSRTHCCSTSASSS